MSRPARSIDLNCDLGEATGADDTALLDIVTSANIACGGHAGDEATMAATVEAALARGVSIGAHPGYPDRANFGRLALDISPAAIEHAVYQQIAALGWICRELGAGDGESAGGGCGLSHVKLHGALYHRAMTDVEVATAVSAAVQRFDRRLSMVAMPGTQALRLWRNAGLRVLVEVFADRVYEQDGSLRSRALPGALITDPALAAAQAVRLASSQAPGAGPHTICIHSDTPSAVAVAAAARAALVHAGWSVVALPP